MSKEIHPEVRDMDSNLKEAIRDFYRKNYKGKICNYTEDFVNDLEDYLKEEGFDLGCVLQYKTE